MKICKRCLAAMLAFVIFISSENISEAAGGYDYENFIWNASDAEIVAEYYGLEKAETNVLLNEAINGGYEYQLSTPYDNGTEGKADLVAVDYVNKQVYAKNLHAGMYTWVPTQVVLYAGGEEEVITLDHGTCYFNEIEYNASQVFTYSGNSYDVEVIYEIKVDISVEEQSRILQIPVILAQTAENLEVNLRGVQSDLRTFEEMIPYLEQLLTLTFPVEKQVINKETNEMEILQTTEPAFDLVKDAEVIASIEALAKEYKEHEGLLLLKICEEYEYLSGTPILSFSFEKGLLVQETSAALYEHMLNIRTSNAIRNACNKLYQMESELYQKVKDVQSTARRLLGSASRKGKLTLLQEKENWIILDEDIKAQIFSEKYTEQDFTDLEYAVYALRSKQVEAPEVSESTITAATFSVHCSITFYKLDITIGASVASGQTDDDSLIPLEAKNTTILLLEGTEEADVWDAIEKNGVESNTLSGWNALNEDYQINIGNYDREVTGVPNKLEGDTSCQIVYTPKMYKVKTNFRGTERLPYGYQMEFPKGSDENNVEDISYDYVVEKEDGTKLSYNEGVIYKVMYPVTITQTTGKEKSEYRLYDFLINDSQYAMSDEAKQILSSSAIDSPTLKIRVPDGSSVGQIVFENGVYQIKADDYSSGILGMSWEPDVVSLMNGDTLLEIVDFENGIAAWERSDFTHVKVSYRLEIRKVQGGIFNEDLDETEDVLYALNLPHELVTQTVKQNQLLSAQTGRSLRVLYKEMQSVSQFLTLTNLNIIEGTLATDEAKNAIRRLKTEGWDQSNGQLALYYNLRQCEDTNWSLAAYYKLGLYEKIAEQTKLLADCLEVIAADPGFIKVATDLGMSDKLEQINELLPTCKELSEQIEGPHKAINVNDEEYEELIGVLLSMEGKTSSVETSNGIYAYESIRRDGENSGSLTVYVQVGSKPAKKREVSYSETAMSHVLTEEEAAVIMQYIAEMEAEIGMTEDEKVYYTCDSSPIPKAGDIVNKNETISLFYNAKEYTVSIKDVSLEDYQENFRYSPNETNYVIELPPYSDDPKENIEYQYLINGEKITVSNGNTKYYSFEKEHLTTLFNENCRFEMIRIELHPITVELSRGENMVKGCRLENDTLYLDANPQGITEEQLKKILTFQYDKNPIENVTYIPYNRVSENQRLLGTGSQVICNVEDKNGNIREKIFDIAMMGDCNKDGVVNQKDILAIAYKYLEKAEGGLELYDAIAQKAADMNHDNNYMSSNDALKIWKKIINWDSYHSYLSN